MYKQQIIYKIKNALKINDMKKKSSTGSEEIKINENIKENIKSKKQSCPAA
jgi:hypothetical protein